MTTPPVRRTAAIAVLPLLLAGAFGLTMTVGAAGLPAHAPHSVSRVHYAADGSAPDNTAWE